MPDKSHHRGSEEGVVSFLGVDDLELSVAGFGQNGEVSVVREVPSFDMELVENLMMADAVSPNLIDLDVFELVQAAVMLVELSFNMYQVVLYISVQLNLNVYHFYNKFIIFDDVEIHLTPDFSSRKREKKLILNSLLCFKNNAFFSLKNGL